MPSELLRGENATTVASASVAATATAAASPDAVACLQHDPSPGDFRGSTGGGCRSGEGGGGMESAGAASNRKVAVQSEHLLSRNVQAGRVVAFAGGATGALLVSQEFGERRSQHGITKVRRDWLSCGCYDGEILVL